MKLKQWTINQIRPKIDAFKSFLDAKGAEILETRNQWEVVRFKTKVGISIIYYRKNGCTTFCGEALQAWLCFKSIDYLNWRGAPQTKLVESKSSAIRAIRKRDGNKCFFCQQIVSVDDESQEHLVSRTHNGPDHIANKALAHKTCNALAGHMSLMEKIKIHLQAVMQRKNMGIKEDNEIIDQAKAILHTRIHQEGAFANNAQAIKDYLTLYLAEKDRECFGVIALDTQGKVVGNLVLFKGTIDHAQVYPREVVKAALKYNATSVVIYHNHPLGNCIASKGDKDVTKRLKEALATVDVKLVDHIIVAGTKTLSFHEKGYL